MAAPIGFPAMTSMWGAPIHRRWRGANLRDPRQAKFLTLASLKWVLRNRAYTPWYLVRYWRLLKFKLANPHIITRGMVFLGKGVEGATLRCQLTTSGKNYGVNVTVTGVDGGTVNYRFEVEDQPS